MRIYKILLLLSSIFLSSLLLASTNNQKIDKVNYLEKFHAHNTVKKLTIKNLKSLNFINVISKNFGYIDGDKLRKEYITAKMLLLKKDIIGAKKTLLKNEKEINNALHFLSLKYKKDTNKILNESVNQLSLIKLDVYINNDTKKMNLFKKNQLRIEVAYINFKNAEKAFQDRNFKNSINLYRAAKKHAINIMKDLAKPNKKEEIAEKYKIHIVDNRQEIFNKS